MTEFRGERHNLRSPCVACGASWGRITTRNGQDSVFCGKCARFQYNAPKTETGRTTRSVTTIHDAIKPKQRARILFRGNGRCELCGGVKELHVGHLLSVKAGLKLGLTESQLNDDENLAAMCAECNLGIGREPVPLRFMMAVLLARLSEAEKC